LHWLGRAFEHGKADAAGSISNIYAEGLGGPRDEVRAIEWLRVAAEADPKGFALSLAERYETGHGVDADLRESLQLYESAALAGDPEAQTRLGKYALSGSVPDSKSALRWFRAAAKQGHAGAQAGLGALYLRSEDVEKDSAESLRWYRRAAQRGNASAMLGIGLAYMNGDAVEANDTEANRWLLRAAEGGHRTGQLLLAARAREGAGFEAPDLELAFRWFERAARQGDATARYMTAYSYARGEGVERDQAQAFAWAELSSESGQQDSFAVRKNLRSSMSKEERRRGLELMKSLREPVLEEQKWKMHTIPRSGS
ncbi:MAG: tetratricopeptide repeat protein, partial [Myxococcota bacterium]